MVENIEKLRSKKKANAFHDAKFPLQVKIGLPSPKTREYIASGITLLTRGRRGKCSLGENFAAGILRSKELKRNSRVYVRARGKVLCRRRKK
jgi:hypothetical protein